MHMTLALPVQIFIDQFKIVSPDQLGEDQVQLHIRETVSLLAFCSNPIRYAYFCPKQPRVPKEKGWLASLTSVECGSSHLSGLNFIGSAKYCSS